MSKRMIQRTIPKTIVTVFIVIFLVSYYFPVTGLAPVSSMLTKWVTVITAVSYWMGATAIALMWGKHVIRKTPQMYFAMWTLISMVSTIIIGQVLGLNHKLYTSIVSAIVSNFGILLYAMMVPFLFAAGYRALRVRSFESAALVLSMLIVYIGQSPAGGTMLPFLGVLKEFINKSFATGTGRAVLIANAFGSVVLGVRAILGKEPGLLGESKTTEES